LKKRTFAVSRLDIRFAQERTRLGDLWGTRPIELTDTELPVRLSFHLTAGGACLYRTSQTACKILPLLVRSKISWFAVYEVARRGRRRPHR
jgi:hypothetical protein